MKILVMGDARRYEKYKPAGLVPAGTEIVFSGGAAGDDALLERGGDAEVLLVDAISAVSGYLIAHMPNLRLIHSEGVGYEGVDLGAAARRNVYVCNNKGCNAAAVAEQAILLMLALLRSAITGDRQVREGRQMKAKETAMINGITELGDCAVGLIGLGDIGRATAERLRAFGCELYYYSRTRKSPAEEAALGVGYLPLEALAEQSDIVSVHTASTRDTLGLINRAFLSHMKKTAYLINTARGELVDNLALREAIMDGRIAGAGLDTIYPEPIAKDNPLVDLPGECRDRVVYSPHFGGITTGSFKRAHAHMWENIARLGRGEKPDNIVNGL